MGSNRVPEMLSCNFYFKHVVKEIFQIGSYSKRDIPSPETYGILKNSKFLRIITGTVCVSANLLCNLI